MRLSHLFGIFPLLIWTVCNYTPPPIPPGYQLNILMSIDHLWQIEVSYEVVFVGDFIDAGIITTAEHKTMGYEDIGTSVSITFVF